MIGPRHQRRRRFPHAPLYYAQAQGNVQRAQGGRRLDFMMQEFNRESNTICSKSNAVAVTAAGIELKVVIDQFREQVQNLE